MDPYLSRSRRPSEIAAYLRSLGEPVRFAILDDVDDVGELGDHLVLTDDFVGLQDRDVPACVELLERRRRS